MTEPERLETAQPREQEPVTNQFAVGYVPGVMPGKWFRRWEERRHKPALSQYPVRADSWREALTSGEIKACFVRLEWEDRDPSLEELREEFRAVALYEELQVVVLDKDHILTVAETLTTAELTAESEPQKKPATDEADMAVELTAAGVGPVILPMSVARLHHRKDVTYRELTDAPTIPWCSCGRRISATRTRPRSSSSSVSCVVAAPTAVATPRPARTKKHKKTRKRNSSPVPNSAEAERGPREQKRRRRARMPDDAALVSFVRF
ncbi:hypothetical protein [Kocuria atrinae]|uniref:hypothetical protein n=1 Tax=Kocuria atrinae TaxID=592377 RepID=UPI00031DDE12|nr:hypothetical protein [Kocuria atrinae]